MTEILYSPQARKFLKNCPLDLFMRLRAKIKLLALDPFPHDSKRVQGEKGKVFRIRVGDMRVIYELHIDDDAIAILKIGKRKGIY